MIAVKSTSNSKEFDILICAFLGIKHAKIPIYIKYIFPCCFQYCDHLQTVDFEKNSKLIRIGNFAFSNFYNKKITIPSHCKYIDSNCFSNSSIKKVDFEKNSRIEIIHENTFNCSSIENVVFPPSVCFVESCTFYYCRYLKSICFLGANIYLQDFFMKLSTIDIIDFQNANKIYLGENEFDTSKIMVSLPSILDYCNSSD